VSARGEGDGDAEGEDDSSVCLRFFDEGGGGVQPLLPLHVQQRALRACVLSSAAAC